MLQTCVSVCRRCMGKKSTASATAFKGFFFYLFFFILKFAHK